MININSQISQKELERAFYFIYKKKSIIRLMIFFGIVILTLGFIALLPVLFNGKKLEVPTIFSLILGLFFIFHSKFHSTSLAKKLFNQKDQICESITYQIDEDVIKFKSPAIESTLKWDLILYFMENQEFLILFQANNVATILLKRTFDDSNYQKIKEILTNRNLKKH